MTNGAGRNSARNFKMGIGQIANPLPSVRDWQFVKATGPNFGPERGGARPRSSARESSHQDGRCPVCGKYIGPGRLGVKKNQWAGYSPKKMDLHLALTHAEFGDGPSFASETDCGLGVAVPEVTLRTVIEESTVCAHRELETDRIGELWCMSCGLVITSVPLLAGFGSGSRTKRHRIGGRCRTGRPIGRPPIDFTRFWAQAVSLIREGNSIRRAALILNREGVRIGQTTLGRELRSRGVQYPGMIEARAVALRRDEFRSRQSEITKALWASGRYSHAA